MGIAKIPSRPEVKAYVPTEKAALRYMKEHPGEHVTIARAADVHVDGFEEKGKKGFVIVGHPTAGAPKQKLRIRTEASEPEATE